MTEDTPTGPTAPESNAAQTGTYTQLILPMEGLTPAPAPPDLVAYERPDWVPVAWNWQEDDDPRQPDDGS